ncbi:glutamate-5-semialdehyde dehydrogenase [Microbacter margulisiae]|uniref:Gamma-glutamyl phosphate reductase n=1 Tax=Microbacter margulisiae TaxID=1350067 RepID=A0A7W5H2Y0_9PORP|nr:glutamate-5-semialdehyde dehydrogenase [Microbacter margulisiae]MBB3188029.1 glutamate-5-semialdehyde dehydrogenase [Microbacter margulisiae]
MNTLSLILAQAKTAKHSLNRLDDGTIRQVLVSVAIETVKQTNALLDANQKDLNKMDKSDPKYDRLKLTEARIKAIAQDMQNVAELPSPVNEVLLERKLSNGLILKKISVPFGIIGIIYEARPNVSFDVFSLCLKSGNVCLLKGGSDAQYSNTAIVTLIQTVLETFNIDPHVISLLSPERESTLELLHAVGKVDLIIPRGSQGLIEFVRDNARVPIIETGAGICHTYFDEYGDVTKGASIINNAKTRRVSVCNALDCAIIHRSRLADLPRLVSALALSNVIIYADEPAFEVLQANYPEHLLQKATEASYGTEFLDYKIAIKTVGSIDEALLHIDHYSSKHSEAIISENEERIALFQQQVDAACVYANSSTAFTDGAQFGMGAEIGISTQKLHARGPMALQEMTTYKWLISGNGQTRPK